MRSVRNCPVAIVGGAGFLGSHVVNHLIEDRNCEVLVIDNLVAGRREFIHPKAKFVHHDITESRSYLRRLFIDHKIRFVGNWAAHPYVPDSFARPLHVFAVNANGALNVIDAAQDAGCEAILQVSSAEIYGDSKESPLKGEGLNNINEHFRVSPHSSYGAAKAAIDAMVQVRWREAKTPCIALRQFNCVGERETHPYIVPEIIGQLAKCAPSLYGKQGTELTYVPVVELGNNSFRDFLYAGDAVRIAVELLERGSFGEVYNLGSETGVKMYDLAQMIGEEMGFKKVKVVQDPARVRPWEIWHLQSDNTKIKSVVGQESMAYLHTLQESLRRTINWYRDNSSKWPWEK